MPIYKKKDGTGFIVKVNYTDENGVHKQIKRCNDSTLTKGDAKKVEAELLQKVAMNKLDTNNITFNELFNEFLSVKSEELKASTLRGYRSRVPIHILPMFKDIRIYNITAKEIQAWKSSINALGFKLSYRKSLYKEFSCIMSYAVKFYGLPINPVTFVGNFKDSGKIETDVIHYWTYEEFCKFKSVAYARSYLYIAMNILYYCGLRKGEMFALTWNDYDGKVLSITKSMNQKTNPFETTCPKNKTSIRKVPVPGELKELLDQHKKEEFAKEGITNDSYICGGVEPIHETTLCNYKNKYAKLAGLPQIRIHDLRHSYCSNLLLGGINTTIVAKLMGHSDTKMINLIYGHLFPDTNNEVIEYFDKLAKK